MNTVKRVGNLLPQHLCSTMRMTLLRNEHSQPSIINSAIDDSNIAHKPVLKKEIVSLFNPQPGQVINLFLLKLYSQHRVCFDVMFCLQSADTTQELVSCSP